MSPSAKQMEAGIPMEEEEVMVSYEEIDRLQDMGISAADISKLKQHGLHTVHSVMMRTRKELSAIKGITDAKIDKIQSASEKFMELGYVTATEFMEMRQNVIAITTGSTAFDELLGGGIETMSITEVFGEFRCGKTQLCHTLCVTSQLPTDMNGGNGKVVYIDTEGTFRPDRLIPIAERYGLDPNVVLDNIIVARVHNHEHQMKLIQHIGAKMVEGHYRMLIVDSITSLYRVDFSGRGELAARQQSLAQMLSMLTKIASEFNVAVVITNQVVSDPGATAMFVSDPKKPVGGHVIAHASTTRLYFRKGRGEQRIVKIYDSPNRPESECVFAITNEGIADGED